MQRCLKNSCWLNGWKETNRLEKKIYFVSLGCDKNLVDSEVMLGLLKAGGYVMTNDAEDADVIIINTCGFIRDAQDESVETLLEMAELKKKGSCKVLVAAGCLAQRYQQDILDEIPEIDAVIGTSSYDEICRIIDGAMEGRRQKLFKDLSLLPVSDVPRVTSIGSYSSYLKIAEGCSKHCTYCIIPSLRGPYRSYPMEYLLDQARYLASQGTRELNIVAQETTVYGMDLEGRKMLPELLDALCGIEGIEWIRLLYCYPEEIDDKLIDVIRRQPKICHYLDMPIQHCNDRLLRLMGRKTNKAELTDIVSKLRKAVPDIALRTTLIAGFPGETDAEHEEMAAFVRQMRFDRLGVFEYSREDGTPAAAMEGQISDEVKAERAKRLMQIQQDLVFKYNESMIGRTLPVMIDGYLPEEDIYVGRTYRDTQEIDGSVYVYALGEHMSGDVIKVRISEADFYDLIGDEIDEFTE